MELWLLPVPWVSLGKQTHYTPEVLPFLHSQSKMPKSMLLDSHVNLGRFDYEQFALKDLFWNFEFLFLSLRWDAFLHRDLHFLTVCCPISCFLHRKERNPGLHTLHILGNPCLNLYCFASSEFEFHVQRQLEGLVESLNRVKRFSFMWHWEKKKKKASGDFGKHSYASSSSLIFNTLVFNLL